MEEPTPGTSRSALPRPSDAISQATSQRFSQAEVHSLPGIKDSRCCFHFSKFETFIYVVGLCGIIMALAKICVIAYYIPALHKEYPERSTYYFCGIGFAFTTIVFVWEVPLLYFVRTRKLSGLQQWMFAMMLHFLGSCLGAVVCGAVYGIPGLFLSLSFVADMVRVPPQMVLVHHFIKFEKLGDDSFVVANYKKF